MAAAAGRWRGCQGTKVAMEMGGEREGGMAMAEVERAGVWCLVKAKVARAKVARVEVATMVLGGAGGGGGGRRWRCGSRVWAVAAALAVWRCGDVGVGLGVGRVGDGDGGSGCLGGGGYGVTLHLFIYRCPAPTGPRP